jgi:hypothetical protein
MRQHAAVLPHNWRSLLQSEERSTLTAAAAAAAAEATAAVPSQLQQQQSYALSRSQQQAAPVANATTAAQQAPLTGVLPLPAVLRVLQSHGLSAGADGVQLLSHRFSTAASTSTTAAAASTTPVVAAALAYGGGAHGGGRYSSYNSNGSGRGSFANGTQQQQQQQLPSEQGQCCVRYEDLCDAVYTCTAAASSSSGDGVNSLHGSSNDAAGYSREEQEAEAGWSAEGGWTL